MASLLDMIRQQFSSEDSPSNPVEPGSQQMLESMRKTIEEANDQEVLREIEGRQAGSPFVLDEDKASKPGGFLNSVISALNPIGSAQASPLLTSKLFSLLMSNPQRQVSKEQARALVRGRVKEAELRDNDFESALSRVAGDKESLSLDDLVKELDSGSSKKTSMFWGRDQAFADTYKRYRSRLSREHEPRAVIIGFDDKLQEELKRQHLRVGFIEDYSHSGVPGELSNVRTTEFPYGEDFVHLIDEAQSDLANYIRKLGFKPLALGEEKEILELLSKRIQAVDEHLSKVRRGYHNRDEVRAEMGDLKLLIEGIDAEIGQKLRNRTFRLLYTGNLEALAVRSDLALVLRDADSKVSIFAWPTAESIAARYNNQNLKKFQVIYDRIITNDMKQVANSLGGKYEKRTLEGETWAFSPRSSTIFSYSKEDYAEFLRKIIKRKRKDPEYKVGILAREFIEAFLHYFGQQNKASPVSMLVYMNNFLRNSTMDKNSLATFRIIADGLGVDFVTKPSDQFAVHSLVNIKEMRKNFLKKGMPLYTAPLAAELASSEFLDDDPGSVL